MNEIVNTVRIGMMALMDPGKIQYMLKFQKYKLVLDKFDSFSRGLSVDSTKRLLVRMK